MSCAILKRRVNVLINRAGGGIGVRFVNDSDNGVYFANCSDGAAIVGTFP